MHQTHFAALACISRDGPSNSPLAMASLYYSSQMKKPMHSGKLNYMARVTCLKTDKGRSAGSVENKDHGLPTQSSNSRGVYILITMGQALTLLLSQVVNSLPPQSQAHFSTQDNRQPWGRADVTPPTHLPTPHRAEVKVKVGPQLAVLLPTPRLFSEATSIKSFKYKMHVPNSLLEGGGGRGREEGDASPGHLKLQSYTFFP